MWMRNPNRRLVVTMGLSALAMPALARTPAPTQSVTGPAFGTQWQVTLRAEADAVRLREMIETLLARIDMELSPWQAESAIGRLNRLQTTDWYPSDQSVVTVANAALSLCSASDGCFDPSVGPLVNQWGFGPITGELGMDRGFELSEEALRKRHPGLTLDLCGIAKGYALDRLISLLQGEGEGDFVADLGGEIAARGSHPSGRGWQVAVEDPRPDRAGAAEIVVLGNRAIATSGDKINAFNLGARRFSHIIDPGTGEPVATSTASVSVIAGEAMIADGWATALMAAGERGPAMAEQNGLDALFLFRDGLGGIERISTHRFAAHIA
jgi:thiamine biosynthesis lipoprotein